jgi:plasmid maintenance system antidote protein VapI
MQHRPAAIFRIDLYRDSSRASDRRESDLAFTVILNSRRSITADTALRLGRYFGNSAQFWLELQSQYDIAVVEREKGAEIAKRVRPADAA